MKVYLPIRLLFVLLILCGWSQAAAMQQQDTTKADTLKPYEPSKKPTFQPGYRFGDPFSFRSTRSPLFLRDPSELNMQVQFNPDTTAEDAGITYSVYENIGSLDFRPASFMTFSEFNRYNNSQLNREYFKERSAGLDGESAVSGRSLIPRLYISPVFDRIFGGSYVDIQPNGFVNLDFGARFQRIDNPAVPLRQQRNGTFNFDQQISMNVVGKVGEKLAITANFDNNNTFDFQNNLRVEYTGYEEDIIKKIEIGNVSMPVANSLMSGAQSLFGIKTELQFGKLYVTTLLSQQRSRQESLVIENGTESRPFDVWASDYEENRHFFLGHFFRNNYERWMSTLPEIISGLNITRIEVYVLNRNNDTQTTRNIVGFMDLGEGEVIYRPNIIGSGNGGPTRNNANELFQRLTTQSADAVDQFISSQFPGFQNGTDYVKATTARMLSDAEYKVNRELGYITLNRSLASDEILAVAFEYTYDGVPYKVGELMEDYQNRSDDKVIYLKLLRPNKINTEVPTWDLMMKNIYNLNASQISREGFQLRVIYRDDNTGQDNPSLHEGQRLKDEPLIEIFKLDQLNINGDRQPDGNFDFIPGKTINLETGSIIFPVLEPFGSTLESYFQPSESKLVEKYVYNELYEEPKAQAELNSTKDKFLISGKFTGGSSCEFSLRGINVAEGSVIVRAGNTLLTENVDYRVNYTIGRITVNDEWCQSGKSIKVDYEQADLFSFQTRTLTGARLDYRFSDNLNIGGTFLHLNERPGGVSRFAIGNEPSRNTKYGFDINYQNESRLLTKMVDALPMVSTKETSTVTLSAEFAHLIPGTSNLVGGVGTSYIDDFESAITPINIMGWQAWKLASTPAVLPEASSSNLDYNFRKAKIAWYTVDNSIFYRAGGNARPSNISDTDLQNHYERAVLPQEIFRQRDRTVVNFNEPIFDIAYFPNERGQYNYDFNFATDPVAQRSEVESHWAGITRAITNEVNFDKTNIEYLEFWLMDPFIPGENGRVKDGLINTNARLDDDGGQLFINLGSVSEDIAPDDKHAFENGLPANGEIGPISTWGQITEEQYLTNFFENSPGARDNQDVGLDGLGGENEALIPNINPPPGIEDISADDFIYILDNRYDQTDAKIVQRYKNWNGMENNSPIASGGGQFIPASTTLPDNEDLNQDNTISDIEEYFEYRIDLTPTSSPSEEGNLNVNNIRQFVVDQISSGNGESNWYLFRIPIRNAGRPVGNPTFRNIKYIRMYMTGFNRPVVLRFAQMRLVGSQWRRYEGSLSTPGLDELPDTEDGNFSVSVVNIEENSTDRTGGVRYVLPPGVNRDVDNTTPQNIRFNEQSLQICVEDLEDRNARAAFKRVTYNLINYDRLKMFLHGEALNDDVVLDGEVTAFLRLGTDWDQNYYEIEVPLVITPDNVTGSDLEIRRQVWPLQNEIDIAISELIDLKNQRNASGADITRVFSGTSANGQYNYSVKGRPDISAIQMLMIGVRNPVDASSSPKSVCIWANELRATIGDFKSSNGWAANLTVDTKLADLGRVTASSRYESIGFGGIQDKVSNRSTEETRQYDLTATLNLEKFMRPDKTGLVIPMLVSYEKQVITPKFDPLKPDVPLEASLQAIDDPQERERYRQIMQDRTTRRSINFTNVRKEKVKTEAPQRIFDIENFTFSYGYSDRLTSNSNTQALLSKTVSGGITYNFSPSPWSIKPLEKSEKLSSPYFKLIKDFNFSPIPTNFSFSSQLRRDFRLTQFYNNDLTTDGVDPLYEKTFTFVRNYTLRWDITKGLGLNYNATANAVIDEPTDVIEGDIDTREERKYIWDEIFSLGRMKNFQQNIQANYDIPIGKIPFTDWISADARYTVGYGWTAGAIDQGGGRFQVDSNGDTVDLFFGNFIKNQRTMGLTSRLDMNKLYDKVTFLKNAKATPGRGESISPGNKALRFLMMLQSVNGTYQINESTALSGFNRQAFLFGLDSAFNAPGIDFILGSQDPGIKQRAATNGWLVKNASLTSPFRQSFGTDLDIQADLQPMKDLRIQLTWNRGLNNQYQEIFRFDPDQAAFQTLTPSRSGSYSISFLSIQTAFEKDGAENSSAAFSTFESNLFTVQERLNDLNSNGNYDTLSQDVMIPAFIAAYTGKDASSIELSPFPKTPLPNWRLDYTGLVNIPALAEVFSSFTISHGYNSSYDVSSFTNSLNYGEEVIGLQNDILEYPLASDDSTGRLVPVYIINQVMISEQFVPLIGFNVRTKNNISTRLEFRKSRNLALNMSNAQVTETKNNDLTLDIGYSKVGFKLPWRWQGRTITLENDLTMRVAASVRDSKTVQRKINDRAIITNGNLTWQLRPTVTYKINDQLDFTFYMERNVTDPKVLSSFKRATTAFGFQLRFGLAQ